MALISSNLSVLAYAHGFTLWHYRTPDSGATVDTAGYFNAVANVMRVGDIVQRVTFLDDTFAVVAAYGWHIVLSNAAGVVNLSNATVGTVTDTD